MALGEGLKSVKIEKRRYEIERRIGIGREEGSKFLKDLPTQLQMTTSRDEEGGEEEGKRKAPRSVCEISVVGCRRLFLSLHLFDGRLKLSCASSPVHLFFHAALRTDVVFESNATHF
ncbi:hypothetical protein MRX96_017256 [Rhipicephalus microplus]